MPAANVIGEVDANDRKRIKALIIRHLEEFLSPESLKSDPNLGALTLNGSIAVKTLLKISRDIIPNRQLLLEAISESSKFSLDPTANWLIRQKKERNVLILREIPTDTPMAEIKEIFAVFTDLPEIKNIHSDIGNNWFITFKNQDDCMAAALKLSTEGRFKGHSLKVRVKANLAQAEQSSFGRPVPPIVKSSYNSPYRTGPMYQSGRRGLSGARGLPGGRGLPGEGSYLRGGFPRTPYIEKNLAGDIEQRMPHRDFNGINANRNYRRPGSREGYWAPSSEALLGESPRSRRREMAYPPSIVIGSPRMGNFQNRPPQAEARRVPGVADYPGNFRLFSPESMREIIQKKYGAKIAPKPISLDSDEVRDIVNNKPKAILTLNEPGRTKAVPLKVPGGGVQPVKREDTRKQDRQRRRKGDAGRSSGRPPHERGTSTQGAKPRGQKFQKRRGGRGRKEAGKY